LVAHLDSRARRATSLGLRQVRLGGGDGGRGARRVAELEAKRGADPAVKKVVDAGEGEKLYPAPGARGGR
jgi:hypothetical protein